MLSQPGLKLAQEDFAGRDTFEFLLHLYTVENYTVRQKIAPLFVLHNLIKLRSSVPIFCTQLPEYMCNKTV